MNRKYFLNAITAVIAHQFVFGVSSSSSRNHFSQNESAFLPDYLKHGDVIGITSPGGFITMEDIQPAVWKLEEWGFKVIVGSAIGKREFTFGGTDHERAADFQALLDNKTVKAILCARGGYGSIRILDKIDFSHFKNSPKWIIGFSDITVMHTHIFKLFGIATIHSKMCNSFPSPGAPYDAVQYASIDSIRQCLIGEKVKYEIPFHSKNRSGIGKGKVVGGNLKTIESLAGTPSEINTSNRILFLEDTGEYLYDIDRMFWNLKRSGKLKGLKGLIIGGFKVKPDDEGEIFSKTLEEIIMEKVAEYNYPVCFNFPVGHQRNNYAIKCGVVHNLEVTIDAVNFGEF